MKYGQEGWRWWREALRSVQEFTWGGSTPPHPHLLPHLWRPVEDALGHEAIQEVAHVRCKAEGIPDEGGSEARGRRVRSRESR